jgi:ankyrin repeat protein/beta-lactamase regulating signal transducer with metallopeptidase domain
MIHLINGIAEPWFRYIASATLQATLLALFVLGLLQLGRRWTPAWRYAFMMLALCKFVIPPMLFLPTGLFSRIQPQQLAESAPPLHYAAPVAQIIFSPVVNVHRETRPSLPDTSLPMPILTTNGKLLLLHLTGVLLILILAVAQKVRLRRLTFQSIAVEDPILAEAYNALCRSMKLSRKPQLLISKDKHVPIAFGLWKPAVMLPEALVAALPLSEILVVLGHELAHHRRRDLWISWLQVIVSAFWWFNPVYWLLCRGIRGVREDCCDDMVLASGLVSREDYCRTLLKAVRTALEHKTIIQTDFAYLGESLPLRRRFKRIMSAKFIRAPKLAITGMLSLIALAFVLLPGVKPQSIVHNDDYKVQPFQGNLIEISRPDTEQQSAHNANTEGSLKTGAPNSRVAETTFATQLRATPEKNEAKPYFPERNRYAAINPGIDAILNPILDAVKTGDQATIKALIKDNPALVFSRDSARGTPLHWAAEYGQKDVAKLLLANKADVNARNGNGETPLHVAAIIGSRVMVELLLAIGSDVNATANGGLTPLHYAAKSGNKDAAELLLANKAMIGAKDNDGRIPLHFARNWDVAELLLAKGSDVNARNGNGETPLHVMIIGRRDVVELLLAKGADINAKNSKGETPLDIAMSNGRRGAGVIPLDMAMSNGSKVVLELLRPSDPIHDAAKTGDLAKIKALLKDNPDLIFSKDSDGKTPLHVAALMGRRGVAEWLLANKADANAKNNNGETPLYVAAIEGYKDIVEVLLVNKADVNAKAKNGLTPLHAAVQNGNKNIVEVLLANKADVNAKGSLGITPLRAAVQKGNKNIVEVLLANKADVNAKNPSHTVLYEASIRGNQDVMEVLLANKADIDAGDDFDMTPLHEAARNGRKDMAKYLLAKGASVNAKAKNGSTPLHEAAWYGHKDVVEVLLANKADVNAKDNGSQTPLHLAVAQGHKDVAELLRQHGGLE